MLRDRGNRQPGLGPVDHAGIPGPAGGPRRSGRRGEPAADPGSAHRAPAEVRQARAPDGDLAAARGGHMSTTLLRSAEARTTVPFGTYLCRTTGEVTRTRAPES